MKSLITLAVILFTITGFSSEKAKPSKKLKPSFTDLGTDFEFSGTSVMGKYQQAGEGLSIVENEKVLEPLVQPRKEFKDRLKTSVRWNQ